MIPEQISAPTYLTTLVNKSPVIVSRIVLFLRRDIRRIKRREAGVGNLFDTSVGRKNKNTCFCEKRCLNKPLVSFLHVNNLKIIKLGGVITFRRTQNPCR